MMSVSSSWVAVLPTFIMLFLYTRYHNRPVCIFPAHNSVLWPSKLAIHCKQFPFLVYHPSHLCPSVGLTALDALTNVFISLKLKLTNFDFLSKFLNFLVISTFICDSSGPLTRLTPSVPSSFQMEMPPPSKPFISTLSSSSLSILVFLLLSGVSSPSRTSVKALTTLSRNFVRSWLDFNPYWFYTSSFSRSVSSHRPFITLTCPSHSA